MSLYVWFDDPVKEFTTSMGVLLLNFVLVPYAFWKYLKWKESRRKGKE